MDKRLLAGAVITLLSASSCGSSGKAAAPVVEAGPWLGIPDPPFGLTQEAPAPPSPWTSAIAGFYYVDQTASAATDTDNPYGMPTKPRQTIPSSLPAGAVVEVHGTYTTAHTSPNGISAAGTSAQPVFIRGASSLDRPTFTRSWEVSGSYLVMENLAFAFEDSGKGNLTLLAPVTRTALRNSEIRGNLDGGGIAVASWNSNSASDVVISGNLIHDNGDVAATNDQDVHGIQIGDLVSNVWIVDNEISRNSGDGVQINGSASGTHHIYVGRNVSYGNKQTGMWTKVASDVIFSQNIVRGHRPSNSSGGQGMGFQYEPVRVWFLFNECYDNTIGTGTGSGNTRGPVYYIGNILHNNLSSGMELNGWVDGLYVVNNTFHNNPIGLNNGYSPIGVVMANNIFSASSTAHISFQDYGSGATSDLRNSLFDEPVNIIWDDVTRDVAGLQAIGECQGCRTGSPLFIGSASGNYGIQTDSPAKDGGTLEDVYQVFQSLYGVDIRKDRDGTIRPQGAAWDMGAYEAQ